MPARVRIFALSSAVAYEMTLNDYAHLHVSRYVIFVTLIPGQNRASRRIVAGIRACVSRHVWCVPCVAELPL